MPPSLPKDMSRLCASNSPPSAAFQRAKRQALSIASNKFRTEAAKRSATRDLPRRIRMLANVVEEEIEEVVTLADRFQNLRNESVFGFFLRST